jgi:hypothetical protein
MSGDRLSHELPPALFGATHEELLSRIVKALEVCVDLDRHPDDDAALDLVADILLGVTR